MDGNSLERKKYAAYPEYKDSGVTWLGDIPAEWVTQPLKTIAEIFNGATPKSGEETYWDGDISWVTPADLGKTNSPFIKQGARNITRAGYESCGTSLVPKNSVLLSSRAPIGTLGIAERELCTNQGCKSLVLQKGFNPKFLYYVLLSSTKQLNLLGRGTTFLELSSDELGGYKIAAPSEPERVQIANFLDHETAKIDTLIEEQQSLIRLLKEKRQAVISHALTKGLNPDAPMKDSGVEWLGEVPEHWGAPKARYVATLESGHTPSRNKPEYWENCYIPWISLSDVWQLREGKQKYISHTKETVSDLGLANSAARLLPKNTVVLSRTASVGFAGIMQTDMATTQDFANWVCSDKLIPEFLLFCFWAMKGEFNRLMMGSTHKTIYMPDIKELYISLPPIAEQKSIINYLNTSLPVYDDLEKDAQIAIDRLQERRTALISAAVTGKIDVRDWQPEAQQQEHPTEATA